MLKVRVIPTLLWKDVGLVKGKSFNSWRRVDTVLPAVKVYNLREVDELIIVDITATEAGRTPDYLSIEEFSSECFVPLTVGGGVRSIEHIRELLRVGADKVTINTAAYEIPGFIRAASEHFGSQCIVISIDAKYEDGCYWCYSHCGTRRQPYTPDDWARKMEEEGAGEILITSVERDGTMQGYDIALIQQVSKAVSIPVIASGGAGSYSDFTRAVLEGGAAAVAAASIYHFTEQTPREAKKQMALAGIPVRNSSIQE